MLLLPKCPGREEFTSVVFSIDSVNRHQRGPLSRFSGICFRIGNPLPNLGGTTGRPSIQVNPRN